MSIRKQAFYNLIGRFFEFLVGMTLPIILVRIFTQSDYGLYQQALFLGTGIAALLGFNFSHNLFYFYPIAKNKKEQAILLSQTYYILCALGLLFSLGFILLKPFLFKIIDSNFFEDIFLFIPFYVVFTILNRSFDNIFVIEGKAKIAMYYYSTNRFLRTIFVLSAAFIYNTPMAALWSIIVYLFIISLFLFSYLFYHYKISPFKFDKQLFFLQFKYALPFGLSGIVGTIGNYSDKLIMTSFLPAKDFAIYSVGNFRLPFIELLYNSVGNVILPQISKYSTQVDGKVKAFKLWKKMVQKNIIVTLPTIVFSITYAQEIITFLFGNQYAESANVFRILILMFVIQMFGFGYILRGFSITKPIFPANVVKMILSIVLGIPLIYYFGYIGAAISYVVAFSSNGIIQLVITKRFLKVKWANFIPWLDLVKIFIVSFIAIIISKSIIFFEVSKFIYLVLSFGSYFLCTYFLLFKLKYLPSIENLKSFFKYI
jgi:O-antigen/teichoic acid export membrane protein